MEKVDVSKEDKEVSKLDLDNLDFDKDLSSTAAKLKDNKVNLKVDLKDDIKDDVSVVAGSSMASTANCARAEEQAGPTAMVVFAGSDMNSAVSFLSKSMSWPNDTDAVLTVIVEESAMESFHKILKPELKKQAATPPESPCDKSPTDEEIKAFNDAKRNIRRMRALNLASDDNDQGSTNMRPIVVDLDQERCDPHRTNACISIYSFRTIKEAVKLISDDKVPFETVSIWNKNVGGAYELVQAVNSSFFFINCFDINLKSMEPYINAGENFVKIEKSYHYETLQIKGLQKTVVFPFGTIFAN